MIKTPLSTVLGGAFWTPEATVISGQQSFSQLIKKLFANNEQGFFYDPNDLSTMFQDAAGTVPVTGAGQPVGRIRDKSGRNNHAFQTNSASRPILRQNSSTGAYYLEFDGSDDFLQTSNINFTGTDKVSLFAGVRKLNDVNYSVIAETGATGTGAGSIHLFTQGTGVGQYAFAIVGTARVLGQMNNSYQSPDSAVITANGYLSKSGVLAIPQSRNGVGQSIQLLGGTDTGGGNFANLPLYIGRRGGISQAFNGHIYSLIGISRITKDIETASIEKELAKRTGVTLNV